MAHPNVHLNKIWTKPQLESLRAYWIQKVFDDKVKNSMYPLFSERLPTLDVKYDGYSHARRYLLYCELEDLPLMINEIDDQWEKVIFQWRMENGI